MIRQKKKRLYNAGMRPIPRQPHGMFRSLNNGRHHLAAALCALFLLAAYGRSTEPPAPALAAPVALPNTVLPASHYRLTLPGSSAASAAPAWRPYRMAG